MAVARKQVEDGAMVLDLNVDDGMVDGVAAMQRFLKIAMTEPDISKVPFTLIPVNSKSSRPKWAKENVL